MTPFEGNFAFYVLTPLEYPSLKEVPCFTVAYRRIVTIIPLSRAEAHLARTLPAMRFAYKEPAQVHPDLLEDSKISSP